MNAHMPRREAERRFLLKALPSVAYEHELHIRQFYVLRDFSRGYSARFRHVINAQTGAAACFETHKVGSSMDVMETEYPVATHLYDAMKPLYGCGREIQKKRYVVTYGEHTWEIDAYDGFYAGLVVAEVELDDPSQSLQVPTAFGPWQEVTDWRGMKNVSLSCDGLSAENKARLRDWYGCEVWGRAE